MGEGVMKIKCIKRLIIEYIAEFHENEDYILENGFVSSETDKKYQYESIKEHFKEYSELEILLHHYQETNKKLANEITTVKDQIFNLNWDLEREKSHNNDLLKQIKSHQTVLKQQQTKSHNKYNELFEKHSRCDENLAKKNAQLIFSRMEVSRLNLVVENVQDNFNRTYGNHEKQIKDIKSTKWFRLGKFLRLVK